MVQLALDVRQMNEAVWMGANGHGGYVYAYLPDGNLTRIIHAKRVQGVLLVLRLSDGKWIQPLAVYQG